MPCLIILSGNFNNHIILSFLLTRKTYLKCIKEKMNEYREGEKLDQDKGIVRNRKGN